MKKLIIGLLLVFILSGAVACSSGASESKQTGGMGMTTTTATQTMWTKNDGYPPVPTVTPTVTVTWGNQAPEYDNGNGYSTDIQRMIIRSGSLTLVVEDVAGAIETINELAAKYNGFVVSSNSWQERDRMIGNITIRVNAQHFDEAIKALRAMAVEVTYESTSGQDVTEEYVDLTARLSNLEASETQLLELMKQAGDVEEILEVQRELTKTRGEIEQIKGRMQYLEQSVSMSLIQINLEQSKLSVEFTAETRNVEEGQKIRFYPVVAGGFSPYSYAWDFGAGEKSKEEQPVHAYEKEGVYKVTLTVTDDRGNTETYERSEYIIVTEKPGWNAGNVAKSAWHGLAAFGRILVNIIIWLGVLSPIWIAVLVILYFTIWRKRKKAK